MQLTIFKNGNPLNFEFQDAGNNDPGLFVRGATIVFFPLQATRPVADIARCRVWRGWMETAVPIQTSRVIAYLPPGRIG